MTDPEYITIKSAALDDLIRGNARLIEINGRFRRFIMDVATNSDQFWKNEAIELLREIDSGK